MTDFIAYWIVMMVTFIILTLLPLGIESDGLGRSAIAGLVFGLLNGLLGWFFNNIVVNVLTIGLAFLIGNTLLFGLSALIVKGFRLRWGIMSAFLGGLSTAVISGILFKLLAAA